MMTLCAQNVVFTLLLICNSDKLQGFTLTFLVVSAQLMVQCNVLFIKQLFDSSQPQWSPFSDVCIIVIFFYLFVSIWFVIYSSFIVSRLCSSLLIGYIFSCLWWNLSQVSSDRATCTCVPAQASWLFLFTHLHSRLVYCLNTKVQNHLS